MQTPSDHRMRMYRTGACLTRTRRTGSPFLDRLRTGFTLVELLIVMVIISVLMALILPAISSSFTNARIGEVRNELSQLEQAIAKFQTDFGMNPPSRFVLHEDPVGWTSLDPETVRSIAIIRRMWPQFDFTIAHDVNLSGAVETGDIDGDGIPGVTLNGAECLVYFLGGPVDRTNGNLNGFSKNPADPFLSGGNRQGPYYVNFQGSFDLNTLQFTGRLVDLEGDGFPEFLDTLPSQSNPYIYLSSYEGQGYAAVDGRLMNFCAYRRPGLYEDTNCNGVLDMGEDTSGNGVLDVPPAYKPNSYQLISAGPNFKHGLGGQYDPDNLNNLSGDDADNITNFTQGTLN